MLEKPDLPDSNIAAALEEIYGLNGARVTFLPIGYDVHTAVYRVDLPGRRGFLKLRKSGFEEISVAVPHFLHQQGITAIIDPLETHEGRLFGRLEGYTTILYPFIPGQDGYDRKLADQHWIELGRALSKIHDLNLPVALKERIPNETYDPQWRVQVMQFQAMVEEKRFSEPVAQKLAGYMKSKVEIISQMIKRADELAKSLQESPQEMVLCHSDAHPGNYLVADSGELYLVDWDNPIYAPRERDLMFFGSGMSGDLPEGREERLFYQGYGAAQVNLEALAYYRYERIIQDIAEFGKQLLLSEAGGEDREQAYTYFTRSFDPGNVVEAALRTDEQTRQQGRTL